MSDQQLRALEAAWRASGAVEDEAAWLLERVRVGDLAQEKLEFASYVGHQAAAAVYGLDSVDSLREWLMRLERFGHVAVTRAGVALARVSLPAWVRRFPDDRRCLTAIEAAESWILDSSLSLAQKAHQAGLTASTALSPRWQDYDPTPGALAMWIASCRVAWAAGVASQSGPKGLRGKRAAEHIAEKANVERCELAHGSERVRDRVQADLVPWALGYSDPARERIEARQREAARE